MKEATGIAGILLIVLAIWLYRSQTKKIRDLHDKGVHPDFHTDLEAKILELKRDPEMSDEEWEEILKISEYADNLYSRTYKDRLFGRLADLVKKIVKSKKNKNSD